MPREMTSWLRSIRHALNRIVLWARLRLKSSDRIPRIQWENGLSPVPAEAAQVLNLISFAKQRRTAYAANGFEAAYHTMVINGQVFSGQRDPAARIRSMPIEFNGRSVLDIGCNQGGMLFALSPVIKWGVGVDNNANLINVCNKIAAVQSANNLSFFTHNVSVDPIETLRDMLPSIEGVDVVLLLSVCGWIRNCESVVRFARKVGKMIVLETNGTAQSQQQQIRLVEAEFGSSTVVQRTSADDPRWPRQLVLAGDM